MARNERDEDQKKAPKVEVECEPTPQTPEPQRFPRWKYHKDHQPVIVHSASEETALGAGWGDTPQAP